MNRIAGRSWIVMVLVLALLGGMIFFVIEFSGKAREWVFFSGSPHVYSGSVPEDGRVLDRSGKLILDMSGEWSYSPDVQTRRGMLHWVGDRLGNISAPILSQYTESMTGYDFVNGVYTYGEQPGTITLTLSTEIQKAALEAMGDNKGTVAVYNYKTGEILCAVTTPTFDPDAVPDIVGDTSGQYDGVYVNRFIQSVYTPGSIFKLVTAAAALEIIPDIEEQTFFCPGEIEVGGGTVSCEIAHGELDFAKTLVYSCNCSFAQIAQQIGGERLQRYGDLFGITSDISFDGIETAPGNLEAGDAPLYELCWSGIGQHTDLINPCQFLSYVGAIANGGNGAFPHLVEKVMVNGQTTYEAETAMTGHLMSADTAAILKAMMRSCVEVKYGVEYFPDVTVCAKSGTAEMDGDVASNALFTGFVDDPKYPLAFIVVVQEGGYGSDACVPIVNLVLTAAMKTLDKE